MGIVNFFKAIFGICATQPLAPELWTIENNRIHVKPGQIPEMGTKRGAVYMQGKGLQKPVLLVRGDNDEYLAFANSCTHGGRKLDPVAGEPILRCCSIGHSTFDYHGKRLSGSAVNDLTIYQVEQQEDSLIITL